LEEATIQYFASSSSSSSYKCLPLKCLLMPCKF
jgi:hypothetical protein